MTARKGPFQYDYPKADVTVDCVVFGLDLDAGTLAVLLIERGRPSEPFHGSWALPGGFIAMDETLEQSALRELRTETGIELSYMEQLYTFGNPGRDPRGRVISVAYLGLVRPKDVTLDAADDAAAARWFPLDSLPALAFDHKTIVDLALVRVRSKVRWQPIGVELLPAVFTLSELQRVYEIILARSIDKRNFRRKALSFKVLVATGKLRSEGHRPAQLFRFDAKRYAALVQRGFDFEV